MKKYIQTVLVILVFCGFIFGGDKLSNHYFPPPVSMTQIEMITKSMQSVVAVYCSDSDSLASGFYIGNGIIITAGHVAEKKTLKRVVFEDGDEYPVLEQIVYPDYDCGFLLIKYPCDPCEIDERILKFDTAELRRGDEIFILGNPNRMTFISTKGIVTGTNNFDGFFGATLLVTIDAATDSGNSGSVVLDKDGEIRGVWVGGKISRCGAFLLGQGAVINVYDILEALKQTGLEIK